MTGQPATTPTAQPAPTTQQVLFLTTTSGEAVFVIRVDDNAHSFTADVYVTTSVVTVDQLVQSLPASESAKTLGGYLDVEPYASCYLKWDGCRHLTITQPDGAALHLCGRDAWMQHLALLEHLYNLAATRFAAADGASVDGWLAREHERLPTVWAPVLRLSDVRVSLRVAS